MIYLMCDQNYIKIGYAIDPNKRLKSFKTGNPNIQLLKIKPGGHIDETRLHKICKQYHYNREWFINCPEVIEEFNKYNSFSEEDLQQLKDYLLNLQPEEFKNQNWIEEKLIKTNESDIPIEWKEWIGYYKQNELYSNLLRSFTTFENPTNYLKLSYQLLPNKNVKFPIDKLEALTNDLDKKLKVISELTECIEALKEDILLVRNEFCHNLLLRFKSEFSEDIKETTSIYNKQSNYIETITDWFKSK